MYEQSFKRAVAMLAAALFITTNPVIAQSDGLALKITRPQSAEKQYNRITPKLELDRDASLARIRPEGVLRSQKRQLNRNRIEANSTNSLRRPQPAAAPQIQSFATGGGDMFEQEPNDLIAQAVSLPVNIFGEIAVNGDLDFFAFEALAGQQITIEAFAARVQGSLLIADLALFDASGNLLGTGTGDEDDDALIRYVSLTNQVLIVGIADAGNLGGPSFDYLLNITRGIDAEETEPNDSLAQSLPDLPVTVFGEIESRQDVDFYSFEALAGQTLIVDVDAEVIGSRLDSEINVSDPQFGVEYFYNDQEDGDDSRFNIVLPYTGRFVVGIGAFNSNSRGFYRLNISVVDGAGAPVITSATRLSKKSLEVTGAGFSAGTIVEVNGVARKTTFINSGTVRAKVKARVGNIVTVRNPPDDRRSNPLVIQ